MTSSAYRSDEVGMSARDVLSTARLDMTDATTSGRHPSPTSIRAASQAATKVSPAPVGSTALRRGNGGMNRPERPVLVRSIANEPRLPWVIRTC